MYDESNFLSCDKKDLIGKVPEHLWVEWLEKASDEDRADDLFMKRIVARRGECLRFAAASLIADSETVLKAVRSCARAIVYASDELQRNRSFIKQAVNQNDEVIRYVSDEFKNDKDIAEEIKEQLSSEIKVVRKEYEYYYSENVTVEINDNIHLILVRAVPLNILNIWVNKVDSGHEHGKWLAPDRLDELCGLVEHICDIYGWYEKTARNKAAALRENYAL